MLQIQNDPHCSNTQAVLYPNRLKAANIRAKVNEEEIVWCSIQSEWLRPGIYCCNSPQETITAPTIKDSSDTSQTVLIPIQATNPNSKKRSPRGQAGLSGQRGNTKRVGSKSI